MRALLRRYGGAVGWIVFFAAVSTAGGIYILAHERLQFPWQHRYTIRVQIGNADAVAPDEGQPVTVAGVDVGSITSVSLHNGAAVVTASIDPGRLPHVYANAQATLGQRTPLKDVSLDLMPGSPPAPPLRPGGEITLGSTIFPIDSDEFNSALDADTREYLQSLITAAALGLNHRGVDLRLALQTLSSPTLGQLERINAALASRRQLLGDLVHNLARLGGAVASRNPQLASFIDSGDRAASATASAGGALGQTLAQLPATLQGVDTSLSYVKALSDSARTSLAALRPVMRGVPRAVTAAQPLLDKTHPLLRRKVIPFVRAALPVTAELSPTIPRLAAVTPSLTRVFQVLDYLSNEAGYEPPDRHGYLFWFAWLAHNADSLLSLGDSMGALERGMSIYGCHSIATQPGVEAALEVVTGVSIPTLCGRTH